MREHKHMHRTQLFASWNYYNAQTHQNIDVQLPALPPWKDT